MHEDPSTSTPSERRQRKVRRRSTPFLVTAAIAVVLALAMTGVGLAGGFQSAPNREPPRKRVGQPIDTDRYDLTVRRAWFATKDPMTDSELADPGRFVVVEMGVDVTAGETVDASTDLQRALRLRLPGGYRIDGDESGSGKQRAGTVLALDGTPAQVHPGLPRRVRAVYALPGDQPAPDRLELEVLAWTKAPGFLDENESWRVLGDQLAPGTVDVTVAGGR